MSFLVSSKTQDDVRTAGDSCDSDIEVLFEQKPTKEQAELSRKLMLPSTFFIYKNKPGYVSDGSDGKSLLHLKIYIFLLYLISLNHKTDFDFSVYYCIGYVYIFNDLNVLLPCR